jgi:hypothetical protein
MTRYGVFRFDQIIDDFVMIAVFRERQAADEWVAAFGEPWGPFLMHVVEQPMREILKHKFYVVWRALRLALRGTMMPA